ncbi:MAG: tetratricopeptide repeat protein [Patescibacteria group bacterium]
MFGKFEYVNFQDQVDPQASTVEVQRIEPVEFQNDERVDEIEPPKKTRLRSGAKGLILGLIFLVPLFFLTLTAPGNVLLLNKQILIYGVAMAGLLIWLGIVIRQEGLVLRLSGIELGALAMLAAGLAASIFSTSAYRSFTSSDGFITLASFVVLFFLTVNFFDKKDIGKLIATFLSGSSLAILAGILSIWEIPVFKWISWFSFDGLTVSAAFNTVSSPNGLGSLAVLVFVLALSQYFYPQEKTSENPSSDIGNFKSRASNILTLGSMIVSGLLLLILDWWVFFAVIAAGMLAVLLGPGLAQKFTGKRMKVSSAYLVTPLIILVMSLIFIFSNVYFGFKISSLVLRKNLPVEAGLTQRGSTNIAKGVVIASPVFGVGAGSFGIAYDKFRPSSINQTAFWNTRFSNSASEFFDRLIEGGILALASFIFLLVLAFRKLKEWKVAPAFVTAVVLFFLYPFNLVLMFAFWMLIGLIAISAKDDGQKVKIRMEDASLSSILSSLVFVLVMAFGLIGGYMLFQKYRGEIYLAHAARVTINTEADLDKAISLMSKAVNANNSEGLYLSNLANLILSKINFAINDEGSEPEEITAKLENLTRTAIQIANQLTNSHQDDASSWFSAAFIYQNLIGLVGGADEAALSAYDEYSKRAKNDPRGHERRGGIYLNRADSNSIAQQNAKSKNQKIENEEDVKTFIANDYKKAEESYKKAIELKEDLATALYNLGTVYEREGQLKEAMKQLELTKLLE